MVSFSHMPIRRLMSKLPVFSDLLILALISIIPLLWIPKGQILTGHDSGYPINVIEAYKNRFYTWNSQDSLGLDNTTSISTIPILSVQALANGLGMNVADSERLTFVFWFFIIQVTMYAFAYSLKRAFPYRYFPLFAAVFYSLNFYLLALWRYAAATTFSAYSALPVTLLFTLKVIDGRLSPVRGALYLSLSLFFLNGGGGLSIPLFGGVIVSAAWAVLYFLITAKKEGVASLARRLGAYFGLASVIGFLINSYWLMPFLYYVIENYRTELAAKGGKAVVVAWTQSVSIYTSIANLFRLQGYPDWYNNPTHPYANSFLMRVPLIFISMVFAPLSYAGLWLARELNARKLVIFFSGLSLLAIFFAAGTHSPTGYVYKMLMLYVPGFVIFRSAQYKFIPALLFSFAILLSYTLNYFLYEPGGIAFIFRRGLKSVRAIAVIGILCLALAYHYPYFQNSFFSYSSRLTTLMSVPSYVNKYDEWSRKNYDDEGRTLILPRFNSAWKAGLYDWGYFSLYSPFNLISPKPFLQYSYYLNESQLALFNRLASEVGTDSALARKLLSFFHVRQILLAKDIVSDDPDMPGESWRGYEGRLASSYPRIWNEGKWSVYKIPTYDKGIVYGLSGVTEFKGNAKDTVGVFLGGADEFVMQPVIGRNAVNPKLPGIVTNGKVEALECLTCSLYAQSHEVVPVYTSVLPGSFFYPVKRWMEQRAVRKDATPSQKLDAALGLSMKRLAELSTLLQIGAATDRISFDIREINTHLNTVEWSMNTMLDSRSDFGELSKIRDYLSSEYRYLYKLKGDYPQYADRLQPMAARIGSLIQAMYAVTSAYGSINLYRYGGPKTTADLYMDAATLGKGPNGIPVYPTGVQVNGKPVPDKITVEDGVIRFGKIPLNDGDILTVTFPSSVSLLGTSIMRNVKIDNRDSVCQIREISGFDRSNTYRLALSNKEELPSSLQIYVRKNKVYTGNFSVEDITVKPDYAVNFQRTYPTDQSFDIPGNDGETAAYIYACTDRSDTAAPVSSYLYVYQNSNPSLYVHTTGGQTTTRIKIPYTQINQTKYELDVSALPLPAIIVFNENYNRLWRLGEADATGNPVQMLTRWGVPSFSESGHMQLNGYSNGWYIDRKPKSGRLTLEFYPQALFYKGVIISAIGLIVIAILFITKKIK